MAPAYSSTITNDEEPRVHAEEEGEAEVVT
jgi:hypothetical protein